jgi:hypothetical protein
MDIAITHPEPIESQSLRAEVWKGIGFGLLAAVVVFTAVIGLLTLFKVSDAQNNHFQTVQKIESVAHNTNAIAKKLSKGDTTVGAILKDAGKAVTSLNASQGRIEANEYAVCMAVHAVGCQAP